jgi:hypothetical protein
MTPHGKTQNNSHSHFSSPQNPVVMYETSHTTTAFRGQTPGKCGAFEDSIPRRATRAASPKLTGQLSREYGCAMHHRVTAIATSAVATVSATSSHVCAALRAARRASPAALVSSRFHLRQTGYVSCLSSSSHSWHHVSLPRTWSRWRSLIRLVEVIACDVVLRSGGVPCREQEQLKRFQRRGQGERGEQLFLESWRGKNFLYSAASVSKFGPTRLPRTSHSVRAALSGTPTFSLKASASRTPARRSRSIPRSSVEFRFVLVQHLDQGARVFPGEACLPAASDDRRRVRSVIPDRPSVVQELHLKPFGGHDRLLSSAGILARSSSGDGLGIHQPGSHTRGFAVARQPASGRARQRAICPAVARSVLRRAA